MVFVVWLPGPQSRKAREFFTIDIGFLHRAEQSFELIYQILPKLPGEVVGGVGEEGEDQDGPLVKQAAGGRAGGAAAHAGQ